jgi:hypothetical protein
LGDFGTGPCVVAVSTEGGLFEYGTDSDIVSNLEVLRATGPSWAIRRRKRHPRRRPEPPAPRDEWDTGQATRAGGVRRLAKRAGWRVETAIEKPFSDVVRLVVA